MSLFYKNCVTLCKKSDTMSILKVKCHFLIKKSHTISLLLKVINQEVDWKKWQTLKKWQKFLKKNDEFKKVTK